MLVINPQKWYYKNFDKIISEQGNSYIIPKDTVVGPVVKVIRGLGSFTMLLAKYKFLVLIIVVLVIILL